MVAPGPHCIDFVLIGDGGPPDRVEHLRASPFMTSPQPAHFGRRSSARISNRRFSYNQEFEIHEQIISLYEASSVRTSFKTPDSVLECARISIKFTTTHRRSAFL